MTWYWQDILALATVSGAAAYVASLIYRRSQRRQAGACGGGCFGCPQTEPRAPQLVTRIGKATSVDHSSPRR